MGVVSSPNSGGAYYPAFMDLVRAELSERYSASDLRTQGLRIFTTLRPEQANAQQAVSTTLKAIERERQYEPGSLQASTVVTDTQTGEVLALVGGRQGRVDGFNRAINARRPVGSVIKPLIVLSALENDYEWSSLVNDQAITMTSSNGEIWSPRNYDGKTRGAVPIIKALALSLNLAMSTLATKSVWVSCKDALPTWSATRQTTVTPPFSSALNPCRHCSWRNFMAISPAAVFAQRPRALSRFSMNRLAVVPPPL